MTNFATTQMNNDDPWPSWGIYKGRMLSRKSNTRPVKLPDPPPWRQFSQERTNKDPNDTTSSHYDQRSATYQVDRNTVEMVNAALYLRRPLLVTGKPGVGKSTLAYAVASELGLGHVLRWNITSRTSLKDGLYHYDALARLQDYNMGRNLPVGDYIQLGPLGTALMPSASENPRVLLIDEIDKADIDLPNDLLNIFEEGYFEIPELRREETGPGRENKAKPKTMSVTTADGERVELSTARIYCTAFPFVVLTSNGEREFPPPFLRRCLRLLLPMPDERLLARIVDAHLPLDPQHPKTEVWRTERKRMIVDFLRRAEKGDMATDQLLNALFLTVGSNAPLDADADSNVTDTARQQLIEALLRHLTDQAVSDRSGETIAGGK